MVWSVSSAVRDLPRLREISAVLIRHGLGDVVRRAGVVPLLERARFCIGAKRATSLISNRSSG